MKKKNFLFAAMILISTQVFALSKQRAQEEADFLTDKMAYELNLLDSQWDDVYEINYDFFRRLGSLSYDYSALARDRDRKMSYVLTGAQWEKYRLAGYFAKPVRPGYNSWIFVIYDHYKRGKYYRDSRYVVDRYRGGHRKDMNYYHERYSSRPRPTMPAPAPRNDRKPAAKQPQKADGKGGYKQQPTPGGQPQGKVQSQPSQKNSSRRGGQVTSGSGRRGR
ncbi:MAG: hypothetical protein ILA34_03900 [Bacteroidaceae bacterium]|nr:hypothetical protein [Bacteroidaceae bacterium]